MDVYSYVQDLEISNGSTERLNCPVCKGYNTFTATNNNGMLVWNCYKVSCSIHGASRIHLTAEDIKKGLTSGKIEPVIDWIKPDYIVSGDANVSLQDWIMQWELDAHILYDIREHRAVFPIYNNGLMIDAVGRSLANRLPKWKRYGNSGMPYVTGVGRIAVVVEDCLSACIVAENNIYLGVALLGTSLTEQSKNYLSQFDKVVVALDPDALPKVLGIVSELKPYVDEVKAVRLTDDLKYRNSEDLKTLGELKWN